MTTGYTMYRGSWTLEIYPGGRGVVVRLTCPPHASTSTPAGLPGRANAELVHIDYEMAPHEARALALQLLSLADEEEERDNDDG